MPRTAVWMFLASLCLYGQAVRLSPPRSSPASHERSSGQGPSAAPGERAVARDLFATELRQARQLHAIWLAKHEALVQERQTSSACDSERNRLREEASHAAFNAFVARANYYQKHLDNFVQLRRQAQQRAIERLADRSEHEALLGQVRRELEDARRRRQQLEEAIQTEAGRADGAATATLNRLIRKLEQESELHAQALANFDEAQGVLREQEAWARRQERHLRELLALVKAESLLWKSLYDAYQFRDELECATSRPAVYDFPSRIPGQPPR